MGSRRWIGIIGAVVYAVGIVVSSAAPGGGDVNEADFEKFYVTNDDTTIPLIGVLVLTLGVILVLWFFYEMRNAMRGADLAVGFAWTVVSLGLALVAIGGCLLAAPSGVQAFSDQPFVGSNVAHAFAQAGYAVMLVPGAILIGVAIGVFSLANRRGQVFPAWVSIAGYVAAVLQLAAFIWMPHFAVPLWILLAAIVSSGASPDTTEIP
jgi:hypothetical protein